MTTENTDAATRILTKTIRKLAEQLAEADHAMDVQRAIYRELLEEQDAVREALGTPLGDVVAAAWMRMSAMGERERDVAELRPIVASQSARLIDLEDRVRSALAVLGSDDSAVHRVDGAVVILRGDA